MHEYIALGTGFALGILKVTALFFVLVAVLQFISNLFGIDVDPSDTSKWKRSGMKIHTDALTGRQYLSTRGGGLYPRIGRSGEQVVVETKD